MPNVLPTIPNDPPQGIQALLDKVYLWNPDVSNELIEKINALLAKLGDAIGAIRPYSELVAPINQYEPCYYGDGVYVAKNYLAERAEEFNEADWILIATKGVTAEEAAATYLPLSGGTMTGRIDFNPAAGTASSNKALISAQTADGLKALFGAKTDENGILRDVAVIPKLQGDLVSYETILTSFIGNINTPVTRIHVKKITGGGITDAITIPAKAGTLARVEDINTIGGVGTAGQVLTKTDDGMAWQDAAGGSSLPDQTDNAGKFLTTDGTTASWGGDSLLKNNTDLPTSLAIGRSTSVSNNNATAVGNQSQGGNTLAVALGDNAKARGLASTALGAKAVASSSYAIQLGKGTNSDASTFKVANANGNFEMMDANGNVPLERLTYVTNQIGDISTALTAILGE